MRALRATLATAAFGACRAPVDALDLSDQLSTGEALAQRPLPAVYKRAPQLRACKQVDDSFGERAGIVIAHEPAVFGVANDLVHNRNIAGDDRRAAGHRLQQRQT